MAFSGRPAAIEESRAVRRIVLIWQVNSILPGWQ